MNLSGCTQCPIFGCAPVRCRTLKNPNLLILASITTFHPLSVAVGVQGSTPVENSSVLTYCFDGQFSIKINNNGEKMIAWLAKSNVHDKTKWPQQLWDILFLNLNKQDYNFISWHLSWSVKDNAHRIWSLSGQWCLYNCILYLRGKQFPSHYGPYVTHSIETSKCWKIIFQICWCWKCWNCKLKNDTSLVIFAQSLIHEKSTFLLKIHLFFIDLWHVYWSLSQKVLWRLTSGFVGVGHICFK